MLFTHHFFYCSFFPLLTLTYCCCRAVRSELHISNTQFFYVIKNLLLLLTWPWVKCDNYFSQELENAQLKKNLRDKKKHCCFIQTMIVLYIYRAFFLKSSKCISSVFSKFRSNSEQTKVIKQTNQNTCAECGVLAADAYAWTKLCPLGALHGPSVSVAHALIVFEVWCVRWFGLHAVLKHLLHL